MTINEISKELGLTKRAIKFYEEKGLLSVPKDENGYRTMFLHKASLPVFLDQSNSVFFRESHLP